ncbi:MAG: hypothetical protein QXV32_00440 [Conexivisphaerales archaeon]
MANSNNETETNIVCATASCLRIKSITVYNPRGRYNNKPDTKKAIKKYKIPEVMLKVRTFPSPDAFMMIIISASVAEVTAGSSQRGIKLIEPNKNGLSIARSKNITGIGM